MKPRLEQIAELLQELTYEEMCDFADCIRLAALGQIEDGHKGLGDGLDRDGIAYALIDWAREITSTPSEDDHDDTSSGAARAA